MARDYDVIVVGSGGAGHCAAIEANAAGARVLVLEAAERIGGTTITAGGVFYAAGTSVQRAAGVEDSADRLYEHYMTFNQWRLDPSLVRRYCDDSGPTVEWLIGLGVEYRPEDLYRAGIELGTRRGHLAHGYGHQYLTTLHNHAAGRGVEFVCNTRVSRLLAEAGRVTGLEASGETLHAAAVVLACGGLGANREMLQQYYPDAARYDDWHHYIGAPSNQGDAITLGIGIGAAVARSTLNRGVLLRAPHFNNTENEGFMPPWLVLVNREGRRFIDETANYAVMDDVINAQTGAHCFGIIDHAIFLDADGTSGYHDPFNPGARCPNWERRMLETQLERGRVARAETIAGLAEAIGVHPGALVNNIERYNRFVAGGSDEQFFKPMKGTVPIATPPFHATELRSATMVNSSVGLQIDTDARVHDEADAPIPGLYAAGEAAGGVVGKYLGGGNSIGMGAIF
ncbi:MAG TPA: FAD-dependent oxidoreductase, partial [Stellaceae bacterium]|nr:FAD-dependent oxidoreductase [Stellaceae bacterium]